MPLEELYARHAGELYRYAARFTGDPDLAEDVVQDTFVRLAERPPKDERQVRAWLYRVATTVAIDAVRGSRRRLRLLADRPADVPRPAEPEDPARVLEREELRRRLRVALDALSPRERAVVLMREEGFTHHEIAAAVDTTTGSVGTMVARALAKLAATLRLDGEDAG